MYNVSRLTHEKYGPVVQIERTEGGCYLTPFQAVQRVLTERRLWIESGCKKVRILIDGQILTTKQAENWSNEEYAILPKCSGCASILDGNIYTHQLSDAKIFCSKLCSEQDYFEETEKIKDEEEIDYL